MAWTEQIFRYCERAADPAFWAEPLNALTNGAFIAGALLAGFELQHRPKDSRTPALRALTLLVLVIGIGSFLFHTFATRWAAIGDVAPIGVFMLAYLAFALRIFLGLGWLGTAAGLAAFIGAMHGFDGIECRRSGLIGIVEASRGPCLNGSLGYMPALIALVLVGVAALRLSHPAARYLLGAAAIFVVSLTFRTVDIETCSLASLAGRQIGTHFLWHLCNATMLYLLLLAAIRAPGRPASP